MSGNDLSAAADHHLVHVAPDQDVPVSKGHRRRVVIGLVPDQGQGAHPAVLLLAGIIGHGGPGQQRVQVPLHALADGLIVAPQLSVHSHQAALLQVGIQGVKALEGRHEYQEVAAHVAHHPFHLPLVIALARTAEPVLEPVVGLQFGEGSGPLAPAVAQYPGHRQLRVVVQNALGHAAQKGEAETWPSRKASVVSAGSAVTKQPSLWGRSSTK